MPAIPTPKLSEELKEIVQRIWDDYQQTLIELETAKDTRTLLNPEYLNSEVRAMRRVVTILKDELNVRTDAELEALLIS